MRAFATRRPLLFALGAALAGVLSQLWPFWVPALVPTARLVLARASVVIVAVVLLTTLHFHPSLA